MKIQADSSGNLILTDVEKGFKLQGEHGRRLTIKMNGEIVELSMEGCAKSHKFDMRTAKMIA